MNPENNQIYPPQQPISSPPDSNPPQQQITQSQNFPPVQQPQIIQPDLASVSLADHSFDTVNDNNPIISPVAPTAPIVSQQAFVPSPPTATTASFDTSDNNDAYTSNPFLNTAKGITLILKNNPASVMLSSLVGLLIIAIFVIIIIFLIHSSANRILQTAIFFIGYIVIFTIVAGAYYAIAGASARNEQIGTGEAFKKAFKKFIPMLITSIVYSVMVTIGLVLLIVPGIILLSRGALSGLVIFEEDLGPIKAIKRSFELTKGHTTEMLGALVASTFMTGGYSLLLGASVIAPFVGRYHDLRKLKETNAAAPKVYWLNYLAYIMIIIFILFIGSMIITTLSGL